MFNTNKNLIHSDSSDLNSNLDLVNNTKHIKEQTEPDTKYDLNYKPTENDIQNFPDLQNGPSSLIQGSAVEIQQVGIHNFRLPLKFKTRDNGDIQLETKVTGTVSLDA